MHNKVAKIQKGGNISLHLRFDKIYKSVNIMIKRIAYIVLTAIIISACSTVMITGRKQLLLVSDAEVLSMSAGAYKEFIDSIPLSQDTANTELVKSVGEKIANAVTIYMKKNGMEGNLKNFSWEFNLVKDTIVNAFCMPGGKVVFYEGILPKTKTADGLAVVMGHEIAHAVAKHSNERISQQMLASFGASITNAALSQKSAGTRSTINALYGIGAQIGVILPFSRQQEYEADRLGLIFMAMAGFDPNEGVAFWQRMSADKTGATFEFMSTHPSDANRIAKMKEVLPEALGYLNKQ